MAKEPYPGLLNRQEAKEWLDVEAQITSSPLVRSRKKATRWGAEDIGAVPVSGYLERPAPNDGTSAPKWRLYRTLALDPKDCLFFEWENVLWVEGASYTNSKVGATGADNVAEGDIVDPEVPLQPVVVWFSATTVVTAPFLIGDIALLYMPNVSGLPTISPFGNPTLLTALRSGLGGAGCGGSNAAAGCPDNPSVAPKPGC